MQSHDLIATNEMCHVFPNTYYVIRQEPFQASWNPYKHMKYAVVSIFQIKSCRIIIFVAMDTHYTGKYLSTFIHNNYLARL